MAEVNDRRMDDSDCPDCATAPLSRREFVRGVGAGVLAASAPFLGRAAAADGPAKVGPTPSSPAETAVARFHKTLTKPNSARCSASRSTTPSGRWSTTTGTSSSRRSAT